MNWILSILVFILCLIVLFLAYQQQSVIKRCDGVIFINYNENSDVDEGDRGLREAPSTTGI